MHGSVLMAEHLLLVFEPTLRGAPFAPNAATCCSTALILSFAQALLVRHPVSLL